MAAVPGFFITGTDTAVGKTFIATHIVNALVEKGIRTGVMKPVETGCTVKKGRILPQDALALKKAASIDESLNLINPYALTHPLAPLAAARLEGIEIDRKVIMKAFSTLRAKYESLVVEGAGGLMVPLTETCLIAHLAHDMKLPLIIAARPSLGTINHTLLTIHTARAWNCGIRGVIINYTEDYKQGMSEKTSPEIIEKLGQVTVIGVVPFINENSQHYEEVFKEIVNRII